VLIAQKYSRAANGGTGFAKAAGNYAGQFYPTNLAKEKGYQQIIWTDANNHEYLEEAGTMNIFFRVGDSLITAPTNDRILDGITRKSVIQIAADLDIQCEVRPIKVAEIKAAARTGQLKEIFGAGTAAVISPISKFEHGGDVFTLPKTDSSYARLIKEKILNIQHNLSPDPHGWRYEVK
ncbi:MAG: aminotransferase class IV, partial [Flavobacteriaceae bacterium]|nr:aminotransferase class IV [Flavobacteriaceae bacterium]